MSGIYSGINHVGNFGYYPTSVSFSGKRPENWQPGLIMPEEQKEKSNKGLATVVGIGIAAAAVWFFTKGKGAKYMPQIKQFGKKVWTGVKDLVKKGFNWVKNLFKGKGAAAGAAAGADDAVKAADDVVKAGKPKPVAEVINNIDTKHVDANSRKIVEQAIADTPTAAQQKAYDEAIRYVKPTPEEAKVIKQVNAAANKESAIARQIQNNTSASSVEALQRARAGATEVNTAISGAFENGAAKFQVKNGKIVEIVTQEGRTITDPLKIAKYQHKHGIDVAALAQTSAPNAAVIVPKPQVATGAAQASVADDVLKKQQMEQMWAEQGLPNSLKAQQMEQMWAQHSLAS